VGGAPPARGDDLFGYFGKLFTAGTEPRGLFVAVVTAVIRPYVEGDGRGKLDAIE
jgi:hypothetical protein